MDNDCPHEEVKAVAIPPTDPPDDPYQKLAQPVDWVYTCTACGQQVWIK